MDDGGTPQVGPVFPVTMVRPPALDGETTLRPVTADPGLHQNATSMVAFDRQTFQFML